MENNKNQIKNSIEMGQCVTVNGMPGVGISLFLKELCEENFAHFYYVDVFALSQITTDTLFKELSRLLGNNDSPNHIEEIQQSLQEKIQSKPIVICFAGFDKLEKNLTKKLFDDLRAIRGIDRSKIIYIFGVCKRIETIIPESVMDSDISMFSKKLYLIPFSSDECEYLLQKYGPRVDNEKITLSGGHFQLLQLLIQTEFPANPLNDQFIELCLKNIYMHLTIHQRKILQKIADGKIPAKIDPYLASIGIINSNNEFFSPLFKVFVLNQKSKKIPAKEGKLFRLLKARSGTVVNKTDIFQTVWEGDSSEATDWALDSLIYRLRKNETFQKSGYYIESVKKQGYILFKN